MTIRNLEALFHPRSVAVVAAAEAPGGYAETVVRNLAEGGFSGPVTRIEVRRQALFGIGRTNIEAPDFAPDLAVVHAGAEELPRIVAQLGELGTRAAILGPARAARDTDPAKLRRAILEAARPRLMRVLGPGSGGVVVPPLGLNASVAPVGAPAGKIALITQSAAIAGAVLDRAGSHGIGFSAVLHLGDSVDVDLADALDWFAADPATEAILVQFESVAVGRKFMSAARAAARNKPVVAIRSRGADDAPADTIGRGGCDTDGVYDAAIRRAGWVRIFTLEGLFEANEALARARPPRGEQLCILATGQGLSHIAVDALRAVGGRLGELSADTLRQLGKLLHPQTRLTNPVAMPPTVTPAQWTEALAIVFADPAADAVMTVHSPTAQPAADIARAVCAAAAGSGRNVYTCWVGGGSMQEARQIAAREGALTFDAPEQAVLVFQRILSYARNRALLLQAPPTQAASIVADEKSARTAVAEAVALGEEVMPPRMARRLLQAYGIRVAEQVVARSISAAAEAANELGYPLDLALVTGASGDDALRVHGLRSAEEVRIAARGLRSRVRAEQPQSRVGGYRLQPGAPRSGLPPLRMGVAEDAVFGPLIYLGAARSERVRRGCVAALPPLNGELAAELIDRAGVMDDAPAADRDALATSLTTAIVGLSQLITDIDEVARVELDPLHVEAGGVAAFGVQVWLGHSGRHHGYRRFAVRPYPKELEHHEAWEGLDVLIRPIRPEDEAALGDLIASLDPGDSRMRFFGTMRALPRSQLARFTQIDYDREMALVAMERLADGGERSLGEVRVVTDPDNRVAEFAIVVRSDLKGKGLGRLLMQQAIDYQRARGTAELRGETFAENARMQGLARELGFRVEAGEDAGTVGLRLDLQAGAPLSAPGLFERLRGRLR